MTGIIVYQAPSGELYFAKTGVEIQRLVKTFKGRGKFVSVEKDVAHYAE